VVFAGVEIGSHSSADVASIESKPCALSTPLVYVSDFAALSATVGTPAPSHSLVE